MSTLTGELLKEAVHHNRSTTRQGFLERLFTLWFRGFVYNQIWEDPRVDAEALEIDGTSRILTISSGGCNVLNYLLHKPEKIVAIDLNQAHVALTRLKVSAIEGVSNHARFFDFFAEGKGSQNRETYHNDIRSCLDATSRTFWEGRNGLGKKRISYFQSGFYNQSKLGVFLKSVHGITHLMRHEPERLLQAETIADQARFFDDEIAPVFEYRFIKWISRNALTVFSLGIPPSQHQVLRHECNGQIFDLFRERLRHLVCDFPVQDNYFAWQAFGRRYDTKRKRAIPDYLRSENYAILKRHIHRVETQVCSLISYLKSQPNKSINKFVLLDAQDWMPPSTIAELWREIARVAQPGSHVIFRTAGEQSPVETALPVELRRRFAYCLERSCQLHKRDRSAIYGMFHLYILVS